MRIAESITKTFAGFKEHFNKETGLMEPESSATIKVIADPMFGTIKIITPMGTSGCYAKEAEMIATMILKAEQFIREQGGDDESA